MTMGLQSGRLRPVALLIWPYRSGRSRSMVALRPRSWKEVDDFHTAALAHGGSSEAAPGLRPHHNPDGRIAKLCAARLSFVVCCRITDSASI
jgi:hypothetical protein